ncbi:MAG: thermonuclease family protein [Pseudomonadota bacterium]
MTPCRVLAFAFILAAGSAPAADLPGPLKGPVARVVDGETLTLRSAGKLHRVRLADIDAPEDGQPYHRNARRMLEKLVGRKTVEVEPVAMAEPGLITGRVSVYGIEDVGSEMIRQGMAWAYPRDDTNAALIQLEDTARQNRRGLWADSQPPVPPWQWRR